MKKKSQPKKCVCVCVPLNYDKSKSDDAVEYAIVFVCLFVWVSEWMSEWLCTCAHAHTKSNCVYVYACARVLRARSLWFMLYTFTLLLLFARSHAHTRAYTANEIKNYFICFVSHFNNGSLIHFVALLNCLNAYWRMQSEYKRRWKWRIGILYNMENIFYANAVTTATATTTTATVHPI